MGARPDQEDRSAKLAHRQHEDIDPGREQHRRQQRQQDAAEDLDHARAADLRHLLQFLVDLREAARGEAHAVGQVHGDVGDQQNPDRVVDRDRQHQIGEQHARADDHVRNRDRREGKRVERPAGPRHRARCAIQAITKVSSTTMRRRHGAERHAGLHRIEEDRIAEDERVVLPGERRLRPRNGCARLRKNDCQTSVNSGRPSAIANIRTIPTATGQRQCRS